MKIYIICPVRNANDETRHKLEEYAESLEAMGHDVWLPHRDCNQNGTGMEICVENRQAILTADVCHIFYDPLSQGSHFDLGIAFSANVPLKRINRYEDCRRNDDFNSMIHEWEYGDEE